MSETPRLPGLALADADWLVNAALAIGAERGFPPLTVAVIDVTGEVIALRRADGAIPLTSRVAVAKARTALRSLQPSGQIQLHDSVAGGLQHLYGGDFVQRAGGVPIVDGGVILGAAGASGAQGLEDEAAVRTAAQRWREQRSGSH